MKKALLAGINDYEGAANDLRGCVNDVNQWSELLKKCGFTDIIKLLNDQVTVENFYNHAVDILKNAKAGDYVFIQYSGHGTQVPDQDGDEVDGYDEALYLFDGVLIDDRINKIISFKPEGVNLVLAFDACFSGSGTRFVDKLSNIRFHPMSGQATYRNKRVKKRGVVRSDIDYIYLSGCGEHQTSADAFINGDYHGAFTYHACKDFRKGNTYKKWHAKYVKTVKRKGHEQIPQLEGSLRQFHDNAFGLQSKKCWLLSIFNQ